MGKLKGFLVGLTTFVGATALTAGGIALNNHFNKDKITLSYGDKTFFGEKVDSSATNTPVDDDIKLDTSLEELNNLCNRENIMMLIIVNTVQNQFQTQSAIINSADDVESALNNTFIKQNIESNPNYSWKGWSLDAEGKKLITDYSSVFKKEVVFIYAIADYFIPYNIQILGTNYQYKANEDGSIDYNPDVSKFAPEGYSFLGFSTVSEIDTNNIVNLSEVIINEYATYYAVFINSDGQPYNYIEHSINVTLHYYEAMDKTSTVLYYYNNNYTSDSNLAFDIYNDDGTQLYFVGWYTEPTITDSINPEKFIENLSTYQPNEDVELYAVYQVAEDTFVTINQITTILFQWINNDYIFTTRYVSSLANMNLATNFAKNFEPNDIPINKIFLGWSTVTNDPESIVDFSTTSATANTTYYAIFEDITLQ